MYCGEKASCFSKPASIEKKTGYYKPTVTGHGRESAPSDRIHHRRSYIPEQPEEEKKRSRAFCVVIFSAVRGKIKARLLPALHLRAERWLVLFPEKAEHRFYGDTGGTGRPWCACGGHLHITRLHWMILQISQTLEKHKKLRIADCVVKAGYAGWQEKLFLDLINTS